MEINYCYNKEHTGEVCVLDVLRSDLLSQSRKRNRTDDTSPLIWIQLQLSNGPVHSSVYVASAESHGGVLALVGPSGQKNFSSPCVSTQTRTIFC